MEELGSMIENYYSDAIDLLSGVIDESLNSSTEKILKFPTKTTLNFEYKKYIFKRQLKGLWMKRKGKTRQYQDKKFPGFDLPSVQEKVLNAGKVTNTKMQLVYANSLMLVLEAGE